MHKKQTKTQSNSILVLVRLHEVKPIPSFSSAQYYNLLGNDVGADTENHRHFGSFMTTVQESYLAQGNHLIEVKIYMHEAI
jgi:hypothetical protein